MGRILALSLGVVPSCAMIIQYLEWHNISAFASMAYYLGLGICYAYLAFLCKRDNLVNCDLILYFMALLPGISGIEYGLYWHGVMDSEVIYGIYDPLMLLLMASLLVITTKDWAGGRGRLDIARLFGPVLSNRISSDSN